jgi:hypothetical protein
MGIPVEIEEDDDVMAVEEFESSVKTGLFIDYDGTGYYSADGKSFDRNDFAKPSEIDKDGVKPGFTHVVWFNR